MSAMESAMVEIKLQLYKEREQAYMSIADIESQ